MSAAIDDELEANALSQFTQHIKECRSCRHEYELERMTKNIIQKNVAHTKTPSVVATTIRGRIGSESFLSLPSESLVRSLLQRPYRIGMLALGGVGIVLLLLFIFTPSKSHHTHTQPTDANIVHQTYNNFDRALEGKLVPEIASDDPATVKAFLTSKCGCNFNVPFLKKCKLVGGLHSEYNKEHVTQLVYKRDQDIVYLYQAKLQDVVEGNRLQLAPQIMNELQRTGWYFENHQPDCSLIIWLVDSTICCAVADISKDQLLASLK